MQPSRDEWGPSGDEVIPSLSLLSSWVVKPAWVVTVISWSGLVVIAKVFGCCEWTITLIPGSFLDPNGNPCRDQSIFQIIASMAQNQKNIAKRVARAEVELEISGMGLEHAVEAKLVPEHQPHPVFFLLCVLCLSATGSYCNIDMIDCTLRQTHQLVIIFLFRCCFQSVEARISAINHQRSRVFLITTSFALELIHEVP